MIIVTGTLTGSEDTIGELLELSVAHVLRSRQEPGCITHAVARDVEDPLTLAFVEHEFVQRAGALSVRPPTLDIYDATPISVR